MRSADRLDYMYDEMCRLHKKYLPDWRFGQLCSNFFGWLQFTQARDIFFPEESEMLRWLKEYIREVVGVERFED